MKTSMGVSHKSTLLFFCSFVQWCLLVSAGQGQGHHQNCFLFLFLGCLPWINVDTPFSAHNLNFARRSGPMRNGCPAHFQCSPERTGAPSPTMHAPSSRTCSPPQSMATNENGGCPRMGPISGQTSPDRQAWLRPGSGILTPSRCLALRPGLFHFSQERAIFPGRPFPCPPSRPLAFLPFPQTQICPSPIAHRRCSPVFAVSLLPPPSSSRPNSSPWAAQVSLFFFENTAPTSLVPSFTSSALFIRPPPTTVTDSRSSIDARPSTPPPQPQPSSFFSIQHTHTLVLSLFSPDCFVEPPLQHPTIPTPGLQTSCRHPIPPPSTDRRSIALPLLPSAQHHQRPSSSSFLLLDIQFFHLLSPKKVPAEPPWNPSHHMRDWMEQVDTVLET